eukprot:PITA_18480
MDLRPQVFLALFLMQFFILLGCGEGEQGKELVVSSTRLKNPGWTPGNNTYLVSPNGTFCAGFYNVSSNNYAFAVWYANDPQRTVAWMANRNHLVGYNSSLTLQNGNLTLSDSDAQGRIWTAPINTSNGTDVGMGLVLLESGNLVFSTTKNIHVWQSFDSPTFTLLPTQNFSQTSRLVSTKNDSTFASGVYIFFASQANGQTPSLYYNEIGSDQPDLYWTNTAFSLDLSLSEDGILISPINTNILMASDSRDPVRPLRRLTLDHDGNLRIYSWKGNSSSSWEVVWEAVQERCQIKGTCGDNAICKTPEFNDSILCQCPPGFLPNITDSRSCQRIVQFPQSLCTSNYQSVDYQFIPVDYVNFSGAGNQTIMYGVRLDDCMSACLKNCTCLGFSNKLEGSGYCVHHFNRLLNGYWSPDSQVRTYLKLSAKEKNVSNENTYTGMLSVAENVCDAGFSLPFPPNDSDHTTRDLIIICSVFGIELFCGVLAFWIFLRQYSKFRDSAGIFNLDILLNISGGGPKRFTYAELKAATNNFSNEVGKGGFGTVYKGVLTDQRQIAVKKLKRVSQGEGQFWAEVTIIGRIHHLNLVRMWGFCTEGEHRLLVYEYIPNGSLDKYLFDKQGKGETVGLDWSSRYRIAVGVTRAIAYLHEECSEWVLHRDIKPENILLDESFCPKVSDFGLAKLIVSGRRNVCFSQSAVEGNQWFFPKKAFDWVVLERNVEEVVDKSILNGVKNDGLQMEAIKRMVKTAFWCIQSRPDERPSMGKVAKMLQGTLEVPQPPKPDFFLNFLHGDTSEVGDPRYELPPLPPVV